MKNSLYFLLFISMIFSSCQMGKSIGSCPDFKGETVQRVKTKKKQKKERKIKETKPTKEKQALDLLVGNFDIENIIAQLISTEKANIWMAPDSTCPAIVLRDRSVIYAEVVKIENDTLYLQYCDSTSQQFSLSKKQIHKIEYDDEFDPNEDVEIDIADYGAEYNELEYGELDRANTWGKLALGFGLAGLLFPLLGIPALIFANKSLKVYNQYPDYREGRGFAIAGKILGVILVVYLILIAILLFVILSISSGF